MTSFKRLGICWGLGVGMFLLRFSQNRFAFDPETGLYTRGTAGIALGVLVAVSLVLSLLFSWSGGKERPPFSEHFSSPDRTTLLLVLSAFLFAGGGVLVGMDALAAELRVAPLVTAALAILTCIAVLLLTRQLRNGGTQSILVTLPLLFFVAFWTLTLYLPAASDPVLARYYLPVLAAAVSAYAIAQFSGFFRNETRIRRFSFTASDAVILCIASVAECNGHSPLFLACALFLSVFLGLENSTTK